MIAHRFSSIRLASRIIVMDQGRIVSDPRMSFTHLAPFIAIYMTINPNNQK